MNFEIGSGRSDRQRNASAGWRVQERQTSGGLCEDTVIYPVNDLGLIVWWIVQRSLIYPIDSGIKYWVSLVFATGPA